MLEPEPSRRPFAEIQYDAPASLVVALVALPLCLGIALASGAPPLAGLVTGIVGGVVVSWLSGSSLAVSGPAAGLTVIVLSAIQDLGYEAFLVAVVLSGLIQVGMGFARLGIFGYYIPSPVIRGMLAAIGLILILKQIPHAFGYDGDFEGDLAFVQPDGNNTFSGIAYALDHLHLGAVLIATTSLLILRLAPRFEWLRRMRLMPPPLLAVVSGVVLNYVFSLIAPESLHVSNELLVQLPEISGFSSIVASTPDFSQIFEQKVWAAAATLAVIASIETLLCIEAIDKLDPFKRITPANRELVAQGVGNSVAGLLGGIPMTAVIVRGSANVHSGGRTRTSSFLHGVWLLVALLAVPHILRLIPLAALAAVLLDVGYKLAPVRLFAQMYRQGMTLFLPFLATVLGILLTDLLSGVVLGLVVGTFFILKNNLTNAYYLHEMEERDTNQGVHEVRLELSENVTFLNKAAINRALHNLPEGSVVEIDGSRSRFIDHDVLEIIQEFRDSSAPSRNITVDLLDVPEVNQVGAH